MDDATQQSLFDEADMPVAAATDSSETSNKGDEEMSDDLRAALSASDSGDVTPEKIDMLSVLHDTWLEDNADPITTDEFAAIFQQLKLSVPDIPHDPETADDDHIRILFGSLWKQHRIILASNNRFYRVHAEPPQWLKGLLGLDEEPMKRVPRRSIAPAFTMAGRDHVGRISSSQISDAIFEAFIAPKDRWETSAKGWPQYRCHRGNAEIFIRLRPEAVDPKNIAAERAAMEQIRDELSVRDWDSLTALMAQVLRDGKPDAPSFVYADTLLDYRQVDRKRGRDGYTAGHQQNMRLEQVASIYRLAHIYAVTETLQIRRLGDRGKKVEYDPVDWNQKILKLGDSFTRRTDDAELAWEYHLGPWFTTFLEKPNRFVAYIWQKVLQYHPTKEQWTKQLAHYLTLELRKNADNGRELRRTVGELLDRAGIPVSERFPGRAKDRLEQAVRDVVSDNLFRVVHNGKVLDGGSPDIETWTASSKPLPARNWLETYKKEIIVFRADPETELQYDGEIRRGKGNGQKVLTAT